MVRVTLTLAAVPLLLLGAAVPASAATNPAGTGQPGTANPNGVACGDPGATSQPAGFGTDGFANAGAVYAGSPGTPSLVSGSTHAVSEYDVACYQVTQAP